MFNHESIREFRPFIFSFSISFQRRLRFLVVTFTNHDIYTNYVLAEVPPRFLVGEREASMSATVFKAHIVMPAMIIASSGSGRSIGDINSSNKRVWDEMKKGNENMC